MSYKELQNKPEESEVLSGEFEKVRQMCRGLKRVNAPKNFDFRLKSRIANASQSDFQQNAFLPFLRYALPLCLVLFLAGFVVFSGMITSEKNDVIAEQTVPPQSVNSPVNVLAAPQIASADNSINSNGSGTFIIAANSEVRKPNLNTAVGLEGNKAKNNQSAKRTDKSGEDFGGTRVSASRDSILITPKGIPSNPNISNTQAANVGNTNRISVKDVLSEIGIQADFAGAKWSVKSVGANSLAGRAGIKPGDVIESVGNRKLDTEEIAEQTLTIKIINILREGKKIAVELR